MYDGFWNWHFGRDSFRCFWVVFILEIGNIMRDHELSDSTELVDMTWGEVFRKLGIICLVSFIVFNLSAIALQDPWWGLVLMTACYGFLCNYAIMYECLCRLKGRLEICHQRKR